MKIVREFFYPDGWQPCSILTHRRADFDISVKLCPSLLFSGSNGNLRSAEKLSSTLKLSGFVDISKVCDDFSAQSQHCRPKLMLTEAKLFSVVLFFQQKVELS